MEMMFGKAISGGRPLTDDEINDTARTQLQALRDSFSKSADVEKTEDVLNLRLGEELRLVQRMIDLVEEQVSGEQGRQLQQAEDAIEDIAEMVEAADPCDALQNVDGDLGRRLTRRSIDGAAGPCDNRRPSILRKGN